MAEKYREVTSTPAVLRAQEQYYGRARPRRGGAPNDAIGDDEAAFIAARDSFYMATVTEDGWPYLQHRGGPTGFLRVLDPATLAFADYGGNRQLITVGSLSRNDRVSLFLMDYPHRARLKILGHARVVDAREHPEMVRQLAEPEIRERVERIVSIDVVSFDWNCSQHITPRWSAPEIEAMAQGAR